MQRYGWTLLFHGCLIEQLQKLDTNVQREVLREHAWRCLLNLPPLLAEPAMQQEFVSAVKWIAGGNREELRALLTSPCMTKLRLLLKQTDEGVGIVAMQLLAAQFGACENIKFLDGGTLSFTLAVPISECTALLVIDAAELDAAPGTVRSFEGAEMDRFLGENRKSSVHEVGLLDLMSISLLTGHWPEQRALIGVQHGVVGWGDQLTPAVAAAMLPVCDLATKVITQFTNYSDNNS